MNYTIQALNNPSAAIKFEVTAHLLPDDLKDASQGHPNSILQFSNNRYKFDANMVQLS